MDNVMMVFGKKACGIQKVDASFQTVMSTWVNIVSLKSTVTEFYKQQMKKEFRLFTLVTLKMIIYKVKVNYNNLMASVTLEAGLKTKSMV